MKKEISAVLKNNIDYLNSELNTDKNFDIIYRTLKIADRQAGFYFIDGFVKDDIMEKVLEFFYGIKAEEMAKDMHEFSHQFLPYVEVDILDNWNAILTNILSGVLCLFIDGYDSCLAIDCRTYPMRSVEEPEKDKTLRGSRDGFVETVVFNTALIRRRIRSPKLSVEMLQVGRSSRTDVVVCSMDDRVDTQFLERMKERIKNIQVDSLTMNQESLAECLYHRKWFNPFPKLKHTERPDTAASALLEGNIIILVDNSPSAMILPTSIFDIVEEADDYYFPPVTGTYLRLSRFAITLMTYLLTPLFLLLMQNPQWIPESFAFIMVKDQVNIPILFQFLILELAIDGLRLAALNTPSMLTTPLSVIAALVLGEFSVNSGWFNSEVMLYMAFVAVANYSQASFELGYALKFMRIITLILTALFNLFGFVAGILITILSIALNRTLSGKSYLYPLIPFHGKQLFRRIFRIKLGSQGGRES